LKAFTSGLGSARPEVSMTMCSGGQLDDAVLRAAFDAAAFQDLAVDADIAELVHDHGKPASIGILEHVPHQGRLAGAEKAGDDRAGNLGQRAHCNSL
jgi:hypothetical protein